MTFTKKNVIIVGCTLLNMLKPFYKSFTIWGISITYISVITLVLGLLVKPTEQLIDHGHIKPVALIPSVVFTFIGTAISLYGRIRIGDLTLKETEE